MDSLTVRFKGDPAALENLRNLLVDAWLREDRADTVTLTIGDLADIRVTYVKEN